jgi:hypothetical protein
MRLPAVVRFLLPLLGLLLLGVAGVSWRHTHVFLSGSTEVDGTVIGLVQSRPRELSLSTYQPVVFFLTRDDRPFQFVAEDGSNPAAYAVGDKVAVLYLAADPQDARLKSFWALWGLVSVAGGLGGVLLVLGSLWLLLSWLQLPVPVRRRAVETSTEGRSSSLER